VLYRAAHPAGDRPERELRRRPVPVRRQRPPVHREPASRHIDYEGTVSDDGSQLDLRVRSNITAPTASRCTGSSRSPVIVLGGCQEACAAEGCACSSWQSARVARRVVWALSAHPWRTVSQTTHRRSPFAVSVEASHGVPACVRSSHDSIDVGGSAGRHRFDGSNPRAWHRLRPGHGAGVEQQPVAVYSEVPRVDVAAGAEPRTPRPQWRRWYVARRPVHWFDPGPLSARSCCAWTAAVQRHDAAGGIGSPDHRRTTWHGRSRPDSGRERLGSCTDVDDAVALGELLLRGCPTPIR
jgi:hypothetical protein